MKRVVVTGMASITSLGEDTETIMQRMLAGESGIRYMPEWERYADLRTRLGGPVPHFTEPAHFTRKVKRGMGRVALMATIVAERALDDAQLLGHDIIGSCKRVWRLVPHRAMLKPLLNLVPWCSKTM